MEDLLKILPLAGVILLAVVFIRAGRRSKRHDVRSGDHGTDVAPGMGRRTPGDSFDSAGGSDGAD